MEDRRRLAGKVVSVALLAVAIVLAMQGAGGGERSRRTHDSPRLLTLAALKALEGSLGHAVYWAGERPPARLELSEEAGGAIYLRYLPPGVEAGDPRPRFLTVGTYPVAGAVSALRRAAAKAGAGLVRTGEGGLLLADPASEGSVYLAYPGSGLQVEVYDPVPGRSLKLIRSGAIGPVG
jgi:hypothetical protein